MRVVIDADGYRERRAEALRAKRTTPPRRRCGRTSPSSSTRCRALERRVVHEHLRDRGDVETHSEGEEPERYLVVSPLRD